LLGRVTGISQTLEADWRDPWFFGPNTAADYRFFAQNWKRIRTDPLDLFDIVDPFPAYDLVTSGAEWRVEHDFTSRLAGIAGLELTSNDFYNVELSPEQVILEGAEDNRLFIQFAEAQWNNRDDNLNPTRGVLLRGKLDHANTALLSDASFAKLELEGRYYGPLPGGSVLATRLRIGGIEPYGESTNVPSNVRFFAGGPGSVRGYKLNRLGPLDANDNPIGGNSLIEGSVEFRFPIIGQVGGTAFIDFGNVFIPKFTYRLDELKYTVGGGLTYMTPIGPVRAELAYAINPEDRDLTSPFFFAIGQAF
jgi:outer membrane protein assembly factor BamA